MFVVGIEYNQIQIIYLLICLKVLIFLKLPEFDIQMDAEEFRLSGKERVVLLGKGTGTHAG